MSSRKELEVILCIGVPASGKSTWAKEFVKKNQNFVRTSRDDFRFMLKDMSMCEPKIEKLIGELQKNVILNALGCNLSVIVDNTNVKIKYINEFIDMVKEYANVSYMVFDIPLKTCIERDNNREKKVGETVIKRMYDDYLILKDSFHFQPIKKDRNRSYIIPNFDSKLEPLVGFDLDGTLALMGNRSPYDWHKVDVDIYNEIVGEQIKFHKSLGRKICIISGRDSASRTLTEEWLKFYGVEYDMLIMRAENDMRKDSIIKEELFNNHIKDKYNLLCVYDDRNQVVAQWYKMGVFCFNVNNGLKIF